MAKDPTDRTTGELPGIPPAPKKIGRPATGKALSGQKRIQRMRENDATALAEADSKAWNERQCLRALSKPEWRGTALGEAAWARLGELMGYPLPLQ